jgi:hypothetical protein
MKFMDRVIDGFMMQRRNGASSEVQLSGVRENGLN